MGKLDLVQQAESITHPFVAPTRVDQDNATAMARILGRSPSEAIAWRKTQVLRAKLLKARLAPAETTFRQSMDQHVADVIKNKQAVLFETLLRGVEYDDIGVVQVLREGVRLVGQAPETGVYEPDLQPLSIPEGLLQGMAPAVRAQIKYERGAAGSDLQRAVLEQTAEEVSGKGWLKGPYSEQEVSERLGVDWLDS